MEREIDVQLLFRSERFYLLVNIEDTLDKTQTGVQCTHRYSNDIYYTQAPGRYYACHCASINRYIDVDLKLEMSLSQYAETAVKILDVWWICPFSKFSSSHLLSDSA